MNKKILIPVLAFVLGFLVFKYLAKFDILDSVLISLFASILSFYIPRKI